MATADPNTLESLIRCPVCLCRIILPRTLPCDHTFCLECLQGVAAAAENDLFITCPACREEWEVPDEGIEEFRASLAIRQLLDAVQVAAECQHCSYRRDLRECQHCKRPLCEDCRRSHSELQKDIMETLNAMAGPHLTSIENKEEFIGKLREAIDQNDTVDQIEEAFSEVFVALEERKESLIRNAKATVFVQQFLIDQAQKDPEDENKYGTFEHLTQSIDMAILQESLDNMKTGGEFIASLATGNVPEFEYNVSNMDVFGTIHCDRKVFGEDTEKWETGMETLDLTDLENQDDVDEEEGSSTNEVHVSSSTRSNTVMQRRISEPVVVRIIQTARPRQRRSLQHTSSTEAVNVIPADVNYKAKQHAVKTLIEKYPGGRLPAPRFAKLKPTVAVYSNRDKSIYAISDGKVFEFDIKGKGTCVLESSKARSLALTESGSLLIMERQTVKRISHLLVGFDNYDVPETVAEFSSARQLCSHGNQFVVLDTAKKYIAKFGESGKYVLRFGENKLKKVSDRSQMCVDDKGQIFVAVEGNITRSHAGELVCKPCNTYTSQHVEWQLTTVVFTWEGQFVRQFNITGTQKFDFAFTKYPVACPKSNSKSHKRKEDKNVPTDDQLLKKNAIGGMCVDAKGFITLSRPGRHKIDVYNRQGWFHCALSNPVQRPGEYKEASGLCLMPDGRMIICDTGNNRIQII